MARRWTGGRGTGTKEESKRDSEENGREEKEPER